MAAVTSHENAYTIVLYRAFSLNPKRHNRKRTGRPCWCTKQKKVISIALLRGHQHGGRDVT